MLSYETIQHETIWVGKFYEGGRISGTWDQIGHIDDSEFRDLDIACTEHQPEFLRDFYEGYFNQREYFVIADYYDNVYSKKYRYYFVDEDLTIYANDGDEALTLYHKVRSEEPTGKIDITNQRTGDTNTMLPIRFN